MTDYYWYIIAFVISLVLTLVTTPVIRHLAIRNKTLDYPEVEPTRKIHDRPMPLMGGLALYISVVLAMLIIALFSGQLIGDGMPWKYIIGISLGGLILMFGGWLDDRYNLSAKQQIIWPILAVITVIASGIGIDFITNPFNGVLYLNQIDFDIIKIGETVFQLTLWADVFAFIWLMGIMYTTKFLDGLDGLTSGITAVGSIVIFIISLRPEVLQPGTALLAAILAGAAIGFLFFNWHPAKIFLGEGGSLFLGFMLGVLSIIAGSKIATALLVMGIPVLDVVWVIIRRVLIEKRSPFKADKKHLHFRLLDVGLSHRKSVVFLIFLSAVFSLIGLFVGGENKIWTFGLLILVMIILGLSLVFVYRIKHPKTIDKIEQ
ncbi:MAG: MraY family glycosyltransferase [Patescibacteria group bacterium]